MLQYADPVSDLIDKWGVFHARLFRDSCIFHRGSFVKVRHFHIHRYDQIVLHKLCMSSSSVVFHEHIYIKFVFAEIWTT